MPLISIPPRTGKESPFYHTTMKWWLGAELNRRHKDFQFCLIRTFYRVENIE